MTDQEVSELARQMMTSLNIDPDQTGQTMIGSRDMDDVPDSERDEPEVPLHGALTMDCGKYGKQRLSMAEVYCRDKQYVKWVRAHITVTSAESMRKLRLYTEMRDKKKTQRLKVELQTKGNLTKKRPESKNKMSGESGSSTTASSEVKSAEDQKEHLRVSLIALKDWRRTAVEQRHGAEVIKEIDEVIALQEVKMAAMGNGPNAGKRPIDQGDMDIEEWIPVTDTSEERATRKWKRIYDQIRMRDQRRLENIKNTIKETRRVLRKNK